MRIVRLKFNDSLHIGADNSSIGKENIQSIIHSDTIFSMLVNSIADITSGNQQKIDNFINSIKALSSGFLFKKLRGRENFEYYLPRPMNNPPDFTGAGGSSKRIKYSKTVKKSLFVTLDDFQEWISGNKLGLFKLDNLNKFEYASFYQIRVSPQHARDRLTSASHLYHVGEMFMDKNSGIYFLISSDIGDSELETVLTNAGIKGIGGRRSLGKGIFDFEIIMPDQKWSDLLNTSGDHYVTLSLYSPIEKEIEELKPVAYSLISRRGWTFSSIANGQFKRKICRMFGEGSVFTNKPEGCIKDVTPDPVNSFPHKFYRFGRALAIPCTIQENNYE